MAAFIVVLLFPAGNETFFVVICEIPKKGMPTTKRK
jgi:hypothetical protein